MLHAAAAAAVAAAVAVDSFLAKFQIYDHIWLTHMCLIFARYLRDDSIFSILANDQMESSVCLCSVLCTVLWH